MRNAVRKEEGFTLVEMLVALAIFAIIATAGVSVLTFTLRGDEPVEASFFGSPGAGPRVRPRIDVSVSLCSNTASTSTEQESKGWRYPSKRVRAIS